MGIVYSCTANLKRLVKSHNNKILNKNNLIQNQCSCTGGCKYDLKGAITVRRALSIRQHLILTLRRSSTSVYAHLNSD